MLIGVIKADAQTATRTPLPTLPAAYTPTLPSVGTLAATPVSTGIPGNPCTFLVDIEDVSNQYADFCPACVYNSVASATPNPLFPTVVFPTVVFPTARPSLSTSTPTLTSTPFQSSTFTPTFLPTITFTPTPAFQRYEFTLASLVYEHSVRVDPWYYDFPNVGSGSSSFGSTSSFEPDGTYVIGYAPNSGGHRTSILFTFPSSVEISRVQTRVFTNRGGRVEIRGYENISDVPSPVSSLIQQNIPTGLVERTFNNYMSPVDWLFVNLATGYHNPPYQGFIYQVWIDFKFIDPVFSTPTPFFTPSPTFTPVFTATPVPLVDCSRPDLYPREEYFSFPDGEVLFEECHVVVPRIDENILGVELFFQGVLLCISWVKTPTVVLFGISISLTALVGISVLGWLVNRLLSF